MIAGVITTARRQQYLPDLVRGVAPHVEELTIFVDQARRNGKARIEGHWWNLERALCSLLPRSGETPVLLMTDDVIASESWYRRWSSIHWQAKANCYCLFSRLSYVNTPANLERGWVRGIWKRGLYDQAVIWNDWPTMPAEFRHWYDNGGKESMHPAWRANWIDMAIQEFMCANGHQWVTTTPSLFDHVGEEGSMQSGGKSNVGHSRYFER